MDGPGGGGEGRQPPKRPRPVADDDEEDGNARGSAAARQSLAMNALSQSLQARQSISGTGREGAIYLLS